MKALDAIKNGLKKIAITFGKVGIIILATVTQTAFNYKHKNGHEISVSPEVAKLAADNPVFTAGCFSIIGNIVLAIWKNDPVISGVSAGISLVSMVVLALAEKCKRKDEHEREKEMKMSEYEHEKEMKMSEYEHEKEMKMLELKANA